MADAGMLKQINLQKIRDAFLMGGPFSKTELAEKTGLSFPTVGKIVDEMVAARQLQIAGTGSSSGGRCSRIYQYNADYRNAIGDDSGRSESRLVYPRQPGYDEKPGPDRN